MKILVISQYWYPENGVPQRRWSWLSEILIEAGHDIVVVAPPPHYDRRSATLSWLKSWRPSYRYEIGSAGELIFRSQFLPSNHSLTARALNQLVVAIGALVTSARVTKKLGYKPDIVMGTVPALPTAAVTAIVAKILKSPYIIDLRDAWPDLLSQTNRWNVGVRSKKSFKEKLLSKGPLHLVSAVTRFSLEKVLINSDGLMVTSEYLERKLRNDKFLNLKSKPIETVRNVFPSATSFRKDYARVLNLDSSNSSLRVLYAGTLGRAQNLQNALKAAKIAGEAGIDISMKFVGAGAAKELLIATAEEMEIKVEFLNRKPAESLDSYYEWADTALVHLTNWEPLNRAVPSKTYELMAAGLHISGVVNGEAADLIQFYEAGHVVPPENPQALADLWMRLAQNPKLLEVGDIAAAWVEKERVVHSSPKVLKLLSGVLRTKS